MFNLLIFFNAKWVRFHGVMVSTLHSESSDPSSNLGGTCDLFSFFSIRARRFRAVSEQPIRNETQILALVPFFARQWPKIPFFVVLQSFFAPKPHGNACYAGNTQCYMSSPLLFLSSRYTRTTNDFNSLRRTQLSTSFAYYQQFLVEFRG